jgi:hypothetical protein
MTQGAEVQSQDTSKEQQEIDVPPSADESAISYLDNLTQAGSVGSICVKVGLISSSLKSRNDWQYRILGVEDSSMKADILISETKFSQWDIHVGDCIASKVKSNGVDNEGRLSFFFSDFLGPFDSAAVMYYLNSRLYNQKTRSGEHMKSRETVYQISAREAKSLLELIKLWISEGKPQHYTKWCQMHQIVATNLYYMGLVKRTASMSGHYYPTTEALEFFEGKRGFPKKKVFVRNKEGKHEPVGDEGEVKSFAEYLSDYADRDSALAEYRDALQTYKEKLSSSPELTDKPSSAKVSL